MDLPMLQTKTDFLYINSCYRFFSNSTLIRLPQARTRCENGSPKCRVKKKTVICKFHLFVQFSYQTHRAEKNVAERHFMTYLDKKNIIPHSF